MVICGFTVLLPLLISCNLTAGRLQEFPNLSGAPHLNSTKFLALRVRPCPGIDSSIAAAVLAAKLDVPVDVKTARMATFWGGSNAHALTTFVNGGFASRCGLSVVPSFESGAQKRISSVQGTFFRALLAQMWESNRTLLNPLWDEEAGVFSTERIKSVAWDTTFESVTEIQATAAWSKIAPGSVETAFDAISVLCDLSYITSGPNRTVYPAALCHMFLLHGDDRLARSWDASLKLVLPDLVAVKLQHKS